MTQLSAQQLVRKSIEKDELDLLLLGRPEYQFLPKWSPAPGDTDLVELLSTLYRQLPEYPRDELRDRLCRAIKRIIGTYEGLDPVATCILFESSARSAVDSFGSSKPQYSLGLPLEEITCELRSSIEQYKLRLVLDKTGAGSLWKDGMLGDLRRVSKNTEKLGGPSFCE